MTRTTNPSRLELDRQCAHWLLAAQELPPADRAGYIERECGHNPTLHARLRTLLDIDNDDGLLDDSIDSVLGTLLHHDLDDALQAPSHVGPYRLIREIGRGGMGSVWLGERADGEFQQKVALKLIKLGMDSEQVQNQFRRERMLLARLQHPNIAQLIDGGVDRTGRPWFAMEHVDGVALHCWTGQQQPSLSRRLRLFVKLCRAVTHAHQHLIVHRDLKPSNVLVQADDEPRLLDFGIARLVENDDAGHTATVHRFLSRDYAAPEQLRGDAISTATDVYALGLILFELLSGRRYRGVHAHGDSPLRPSAVPGGAEMASAGIARMHLRGDLDAITLRALAEEPGRRYASAQALGDDVDNHLHGRVVSARPDSRLYRLGKLVARNQMATAALVFAALTLIASTALSLRQAHHAQAAAERAERSKLFLTGLLEDSNPFLAPAARDATPDELIDKALNRIERDLSDMAGLQIELRGRVVAFLSKSHLVARHLDVAARNAEAARRHHGPQSPQYASTLSDLGVAQRKNGQAAAAGASFAQAERLLRHAGPDWASDRISVMTGQAVLANQIGDLAEGRRLGEAILRDRQTLEGANSPAVAMDLMNLAANAYYDERYAEAERLARQSRDMAVKLLGADHARLHYIDNVLGLAQVFNGNHEAGLLTLAKVAQRVGDAFGETSQGYALALVSLGSCQREAGDMTNAIATLSRALDVLEAAHPSRPSALLNLGLAQLSSSDGAALTTLKQALSSLHDHHGDRGQRPWAQAAYAVAIARTGDIAGGSSLAQQAYADLLASPYGRSRKGAEIELLLAELHDLKGQGTQAAQRRGVALDILRRIHGDTHPRSRAVADVP